MICAVSGEASQGRRWPPAKLMRELWAASGLPEGGTVERDRAMTHLVYRDGGLIRRLTFYPNLPPGRLRWEVGVGDGEVTSPNTAMWSQYRLPEDLTFASGEAPRRNFDGYPWPRSGGGLDDGLVRDVARFAAAMLWFLADRRDLCRLLMHGDGRTPYSWQVRRGDVIGSRWGELAAGVVQAVILARAIPDPELEALALAKLADGSVSPESVRYWARLDCEWSPVDIADLVDGET
jgi:hypothetical protein